jgi:hypothetical protein
MDNETCAQCGQEKKYKNQGGYTDIDEWYCSVYCLQKLIARGRAKSHKCFEIRENNYELPLYKKLFLLLWSGSVAYGEYKAIKNKSVVGAVATPFVTGPLLLLFIPVILILLIMFVIGGTIIFWRWVLPLFAIFAIIYFGAIYIKNYNRSVPITKNDLLPMYLTLTDNLMCGRISDNEFVKESKKIRTMRSHK